MDKHTVKSYDQEFNQLKSLVQEMGKATYQQLSRAVEALVAGNLELAARVVESDEEINRMQAAVDELTVRMLAKRQPMAFDLRVIYAGQKIAANLERIADYSANIARYARTLNRHTLDYNLSAIERMGDTALVMLESVLAAYDARDADLAVTVWHQDDEMDAAYTQVLEDLRRIMAENPGQIQAGTNLLFIARCAERTGDLITNIAESVYYIAEGKPYRGRS